MLESFDVHIMWLGVSSAPIVFEIFNPPDMELSSLKWSLVLPRIC